ncbi:hypothetical protein BB560_003390 [Smittium megazygosporum]|uniref:CDP-diacylglycerol--serine O-phosphatidyltransferase n=1 Tax=Smittium megazygosporum TaxID=133381 RepID=A0A2T9ZCA8_9FUNG|nr:hypothetical protein BB560_003390 [Smittium megazygosporum]
MGSALKSRSKRSSTDSRHHIKSKSDSGSRTKSFSLVRSFSLADYLTLGNGVCGCMAVFFSMRALITQNPRFLYFAFTLIPLGVILDFFDGYVARWRKTTSLLGQELDSLARYNATVASMPKSDSGKIRYYEGTPIPTSLFIVTLLAYGVYTGKFWNFDSVPKTQDGFVSPFKIAFTGENVWGSELHVFSRFYIHPFVFIYALNGAMMISKRLLIPKF